MKYYLRESEITTIDQIHLCNYCGEKALEHTSHSDHGRTCDVDYMCECEGSGLADELKFVVFEAKQALEIADKELKTHANQVHPSIKQRLFEEEVTELRVKYGIYGGV